jgi:hypothetical protein
MGDFLRNALESDYIPSEEINAAYGKYRQPDSEKAQ